MLEICLLRSSIVQPQILFDGKRAVGVRFVREGGFTYEVLAEKEVILSSGAINSPHLLLLSGIGPKEELQKHGVCEIQHSLQNKTVGSKFQYDGIYSYLFVFYF